MADVGWGLADGGGGRLRVGSTSAGLWLGAVLAAVGSAVAARALGVEQYGAVILAVAMVSSIRSFVDLTLEEAVVHHGFRALAADDVGQLAQILRVAIVVDVVLGVAVAGGVVLVAGPIASLAGAGNLDPAFVRLAALCGLVTTADGTTGAVMLLAGRPDLRAWVTLLVALVRLVLIVAAVHIGDARMVLVVFAVAGGIGSAVQALMSWRIGWRHWRAHKPLVARRWARELGRFGVHSSATTSVIAAKGGLVALALARSGGPALVGTLQVAMLPVTVATVLSGPVRLVLLPEQARMAAAGARDGLRRSILAFSRIAVAVGVPGALVGWVLMPRLIVGFYSHRFDGAIGPARILLVAAVAHLAVAWSKTLPGAVGRPQLRTLASLVELVVTLALLAFLAPHGPAGAAAAFSGASVVVAVVWWRSAMGVIAGVGDAGSMGSPAVAGST